MAWLGLILLALNAILPALAPLTPARAATPLQLGQQTASPLDGQEIVICTPSGLRVITVDANGKPVEQQDSTREGTCVFCLPLVHAASGALAASVDALALPSLAVHPSQPYALHRVLVGSSVEQRHAQSRAPPALSIRF